MMVGEIPNVYTRYQRLQRYIGWTTADAERVAGLRSLLEPGFDATVEDFYARIQLEPTAARVLVGGVPQITRLKATLRQWLEELLCGNYDSDYVMRRWRVGWRHVELGLDQVFTNVAMSRLRHRLLDQLDECWQGTRGELHASARSLGQLLDLDLAIIEDAYQAEYAKRLQNSERLATIGKIGAGIAHELRNPLHVIKTSVYFLLHSKTASTEKVTEHLTRIERQVGVADAVITALSNFARLPAPEWELVPIQSCLREVIEETTVQSSTPVELHVDEGLPPLAGDREQLRIVFGNLLRNAREATASDGRIWISASRDGSQIQLEFADNGCGIAADHLPHVAEPLFTTKARGLGLGLAISKAIVEQHGGKWRVGSELGHGTTFTLRFPITPATRANA